MNEPMVTVMQEQRVLAWPDEPGSRPRDKDRAYVLPLSKALTRAYKTDAHLAQYAAPNGRRLKGAAADEISVQMDIIVLDVDCEETHGTGKPAPDSWRAEVRERVLAVRAAHGGLFYYETRGGSRLVYRLPVPHVIASRSDAEQWRQDYATTVAYMERAFGLQADKACSDWTRLFRLPMATRTPGGPPESYPMAGNPKNIAPLWFAPSEDDLARAIELMPKAFNTREKPANETFSYSGDGRGLLYYALRNRGHIVRQFKGDTFLIKCPNDGCHSGGKTGDTSTMLYPASPGQRLGWIVCLHAHCSQLSAKEWLRCFGQQELRRAEVDAGLDQGRRTA